MQIHAVYNHVFHAAHKACAVGLGKAANHSHILKTTYWGEQGDETEKNMSTEGKKNKQRTITGNAHNKYLILKVMGSRYDVLKHQSLLKPARTNLD